MNKKLDQLQKLLIDDIIAKITSGEAKSSDLEVARKILKDQGYEFINSQDSPLHAFTNRLPFEQKEIMTAYKKQG